MPDELPGLSRTGVGMGEPGARTPCRRAGHPVPLAQVARTLEVLVEGPVLLDGKPVPMGFIRVLPDVGRPAQGVLNAEGRFRLTTYDEGDGCVGTHRVEVLAAQRLKRAANPAAGAQNVF